MRHVQSRSLLITRMVIKRYVWWILGTAVFTAVAICAGIASAGAGHGTYVAAKLLFPYTMFIGSALGSITVPLVVLAVVQYPCYSLILWFGVIRKRPVHAVVAIAIVHAVAIAVTLLSANENF